MSNPAPIAIVGMSGLFPGAATLSQFWRNINDRVASAREAPAGRWALPLDRVYTPDTGAFDKVYSRKACFVDPEFYADAGNGLALDANLIGQLDPSCRLLLAAARSLAIPSLLENVDRTRAGVILGNIALPTDGVSEWARAIMSRTFEERVTGASTPESTPSPWKRYVAGLPSAILSAAYGLGGGALTLDAACASSLYAIKLAADELAMDRADLMICGGLSRPDALYTQMGFCQLRALSPTGVCAPFDADSNGLVVGEGAGLVVLRRLEDALREGEPIFGVIRAIGVSNDIGGRLLAPTAEGQLRAMRSAYEQAGWRAQEVDHVECHATGTPVGDAVEFAALRELWGDEGWRPGQCVLGGVKSNIGHLLTGAGAAALIKTLLAFREGVLPPTANFRRPSEGIALEASPFRVLTAPESWPVPAGGPRRAAVSAFGFGGINAHLLMEEWRPESKPKYVHIASPDKARAASPIAITGMEAHFGPWNGLRAFQERVLGGGEDHPPIRGQWWGVESSSWFRSAGLGRVSFEGHFIPELRIEPGAFRIPPREIVEMLPQQALMLRTALRAWRDAGLPLEGALDAGAFIGVGLDLNTTNFHCRWMLEPEASRWLRQLDIHLDGPAFDVWLESLRDAMGPPLTANRTMGALASIAASRIARELRLGGPSFTLSSEETSGLQALRMAVRWLQNGTVNTALAGAVDLAGDVRAVLATHSLRPCAPDAHAKPFDASAAGWSIGEGAGAVVLQRLDDAVRSSARIYAVIEGVGAAFASPGNGHLGPAAEAARLAMARATAESGKLSSAWDYMETSASGSSSEDAAMISALAGLFSGADGKRRVLGAIHGDIGHAGAASGMASLIKTALSIHQEILPPVRQCQTPTADLPSHLQLLREPQYWLRDRVDGPRRAGVCSLGLEGGSVCVTLVEPPTSPEEPVAVSSTLQPLGARSEALFVLEGLDVRELLECANQLRRLVESAGACHIEALARRWWRERRGQGDGGKMVAMVARASGELLEQLAYVREALTRAPGDPIGGAASIALEPFVRDRIFYTPTVMGHAGKTAFVFPGSGNHFADMGRALFTHWPEVLRGQDAANERLRSQFEPDGFWNTPAGHNVDDDHKTLIFGQVALGAAMSDLMRLFLPRPGAVIGYSLGETAGLFALGAWTGRDDMLRRMRETSLFTEELGGDCRAARRTWRLPAHEAVDWVLGVIDRPMKAVRTTLDSYKKAYPLIANTLQESVIGGNRKAVEKLIQNLQCRFIPLKGVTTVHCEVVKEVEEAYRTLHLHATAPPPGVDFYSGAWGRKYEVTRDSAADSILAQALHGVDFPKVIEAAYADGVRVFLELGPGNSCSRMIGSILGARPHFARSVCFQGQDPMSLVLRGLAALIAEGVPVSLDALYGGESRVAAHQPIQQPSPNAVVLIPGGAPFQPPPLPINRPIRVEQPMPLTPSIMEPDDTIGLETEESPVLAPVPETPRPSHAGAEVMPPRAANIQPLDPSLAGGYGTVLSESANAATAAGEAHDAFLKLSASFSEAMARSMAFQTGLLRTFGAGAVETLMESAPMPDSAPEPVEQAPPAHTPATVTPPDQTPRALDRRQCMEFAIGRIANALGPDFAQIDAYPTRVRLPDEPLMLVDRIPLIEGEPLSMQPGRVITEHDVLHDGWYLDGGRIPVCIAVEAGQADLFLSGFLGIDLETRGLSMYRLLDAAVTFHGPLPKPGDIIRYDIRIDHFFRHGESWFFRFQFDGTVNGEPLITMRDGCAGFFSEGELARGQGVVRSKFAAASKPGKQPLDWRPLVAMARESYLDAQIEALRQGDLAGCFGESFIGLPLRDPMRLPAGRMHLVDRVLSLEPGAGRYGLGVIRAEADIHPDDWFLTCHFIDDRVMPGTLMYECCLHTFRILLMRMGWLAEHDTAVWEPIPGVTSRLKCRGQVLETTKKVVYEVELKEFGFGPEPYAFGDAMMYADGKPVVDITDMSVRLSGQTREGLEALWRQRRPGRPYHEPVPFDYDKVLAYTLGNPSEAFGERFRVFDHDRVMARLPAPPYSLMTRVEEVTTPPCEMIGGGNVTASYDMPANAWYFSANRTPIMPFAVLLEIALQPCGWYSSYMGSALTSETDLAYRNLGGEAIQHRQVTPEMDRLTTRVKCTGVSRSGGMIIQHFALSVSHGDVPIYDGTTYFGFFAQTALANQVGIQGASCYVPSPAEVQRGRAFKYPDTPSFPDGRIRMLDDVALYTPDAGPARLGFIRGTKRVDRNDWFFKAHFYQDPVCPGSLGLESYMQLLRYIAVERWNPGPGARFAACADGVKHSWIYRGQIVPADHEVTIEAVVTAIDDSRRRIHADGFLFVDGRTIYQMTNFSLEAVG